MRDNEISASKKFSIIRETLWQEGNTLSVAHMCEIAGVSRSGYYNWVASEGKRELQEDNDRAAFEIILNAFNHRGYKKGARSIYMRLLHQDPPVIMNIKKIRRLMKKYGLECPIRRGNSHRKAAKTTEETYVAPNLVRREFKIHGPRTVLLTDITYLFYESRQKCYLSTVLDAYTMQILAWVTSESMEVDFVLQTVNDPFGVTFTGFPSGNHSITNQGFLDFKNSINEKALQFIDEMREAGILGGRQN